MKIGTGNVQGCRDKIDDIELLDDLNAPHSAADQDD